MKNPLFLPRGSVRDLVILLFAGAFTGGFLTDKISGEVFAPAVIGIIGAHFGLKAAPKDRGEE